MVSQAAGAFPTTRWTVIVAARTSPEARRAALTHVLSVYWRPLFVFFRLKGLAAAEAADAVQDVAVQLLESDAVTRLSPERGRLRAYLRTVATNALATRHERATAAKRGAGAQAIPLDAQVLETLALPDAESPEAAYERAWADAVMQRALHTLKAEFDAGQRSGPFALVTQFFGGGPTPSYRDAATQHGMTVPQLKAFLHRARVRFHELVRAEVGDTVEDAAHVDAEVCTLVEAPGLRTGLAR